MRIRSKKPALVEIKGENNIVDLEVSQFEERRNSLKVDNCFDNSDDDTDSINEDFYNQKKRQRK